MEKMKSKNNSGFGERGIEEFPLENVFEKKRKEKKLSFRGLSQKTGVSVQNLQKIETGDWKNLPASIYVEDFLSKCAVAFGEDKDFFLDLYKKEISLEKNKKDISIKKVSKKAFIITPKIITKISFLLFIAVILFYFIVQLNYLLGDPKLVVTNPKNDIITKSKEIEISGNTQPDNKITLNESDIFVNSEGYFSEIIPLQDGINTIKIKAINRLNKESLVIRRIILE